MANPQSSGGSTALQKVKAVPEAIWNPFIWDLYPDLLSQTYVLPPVHFNQTPQSVDTVAGQTALVRDKPAPCGRSKHPPVQPTAQVAGTVFLENASYVQPVHTQVSDHQDDIAQQRCLSVLSALPGEVMMVVSRLVFKKHLSNRTNPLYETAVAQLPTMQDKSVPSQIADGECDIVIIHRQYGLILAEQKSVGGNDFFCGQNPDEQTRLIIKQVEKALKQVSSQEKALRHLVSDLPPVRVTTTLLLPNISSGQLASALSTCPQLLQRLCQCLSVEADVSVAVRRCLCKEDEGHPGLWWGTLHGGSPDPCMTDALYERLVARFCGPASMIEIPTAGVPRKVVRSMAEAVAEAGLRLSRLMLTPPQVTLLNRQPEPRFAFLLGPPGTGKTVVLLLKALQWARQGLQVVILCVDKLSLPVTILVHEQLRRMLGAEASKTIQHHSCDIRKDDVAESVSRLQDKLDSGPALILFDEVESDYRHQFLQWLAKLREELPAASVWAAGVWRLDQDPADPLPAWLEVQTLQEALRCPPTVTAELQRSRAVQHNATLPYLDSHLPAATPGPPVEWYRHYRQPGHALGHPWNCVPCADLVAEIIHKLRVGQSGQPLQYRDLWILYRGVHNPCDDDVMIHHLQRHCDMPVQVVTSLGPGQARELALASSDVIIVTHWETVRGLERRVVISLGTEGIDWGLLSLSRCTSSLHLIG